jgi:hypothetical protein
MSAAPTLSEQLRQHVRFNLKSPAFIKKAEALMMQAAFCLDELESQLANTDKEQEAMPDTYPQERVDEVTKAGMDALRKNRTPRTDAIDEIVPHEVLLSYVEDLKQPTSIREMARELLSRRRGEWICARCLLRQEPAQDSNGELNKRNLRDVR